MTSTSVCRRVQSQLGAFVDGELEGAERSAIARHLEMCRQCVEEEQELRHLGDWLRGSAMAVPSVDLTGLSSGILSRMSAERAQSWQALFGRAVEDWHWPLVGLGSLAAGVATILLVSALLWFGPSVSRTDSLAAVLDDLGARESMTPYDSGSMDRIAGPADSMLIVTTIVAVPVSFLSASGPTEGDLTAALSNAMVGPDGRVSGLLDMSRRARQRTEALLDQIQRLRYPLPTSWSGGSVGVQQIGLVTSTECTAKAL